LNCKFKFVPISKIYRPYISVGVNEDIKISYYSLSKQSSAPWQNGLSRRGSYRIITFTTLEAFLHPRILFVVTKEKVIDAIFNDLLDKLKEILPCVSLRSDEQGRWWMEDLRRIAVR